MNTGQEEIIHRRLDALQIELPSWAFANTGTRFGKFIDPSAATTIEEKLADAAQVNRFTGCCPSVAVHVLWDFPEGLKSAGPASRLARDLGVRIGSVSPNVFQDQDYKYGALANPTEPSAGRPSITSSIPLKSPSHRSRDVNSLVHRRLQLPARRICVSTSAGSRKACAMRIHISMPASAC